MSPVVVILGGFLVVVGVGLPLLALTGRFAHQYLVFEPAGIRFGERRHSYVVPWDAIAAVVAGEYQSHSVVLLPLRDVDLDVDAVLATAKPHAGTAAVARRRVARELERNAAWYGAPAAILPASFGLDAAFLVRALEGYVGDPASRATLAPGAALPPPQRPRRIGSGAGLRRLGLALAIGGFLAGEGGSCSAKMSPGSDVGFLAAGISLLGTVSVTAGVVLIVTGWVKDGLERRSGAAHIEEEP